MAKHKKASAPAGAAAAPKSQTKAQPAPGAAAPAKAAPAAAPATKSAAPAAAAKPAAAPAAKPSPDQISARAHQIWIEAGRPVGRSLDHWLQAERELKG